MAGVATSRSLEASAPGRREKEIILWVGMVHVLWRYPPHADDGCNMGAAAIVSVTRPMPPPAPTTSIESLSITVRGTLTECAGRPETI